MSKSALMLKAVPRTYAELRSSVQETLLTGQRRIEQAKVRTYWETGRLIQDHLLIHKDRARYGGQIISRLAEDLGISDRVLYHCVQFARTFPILNRAVRIHLGALSRLAANRRQIAAQKN